MSDYITKMIINELDMIYSGNLELKLVEDRKNTLDSLIQSAADNKIIEANSFNAPFTEEYKNIWEELKIWETHENFKELFTLISKYSDDLSSLEVILSQNSVNVPEIPKAPVIKPVKATVDINRVLKLLKSMQLRCGRIEEIAAKCWKKEEYKDKCNKYLEFERIKKLFDDTGKILDETIGKVIEDIKWPLQADSGDKQQELLVKVMDLIAKSIMVSDLPAVEAFNELMRCLPKFIAKHYIARLKIRMQCHFSDDMEIANANRPELILNYAFDQLKTLKQYVESLEKPDAFIAMCNYVIDDLMIILMGYYQKKHNYLVNRMSIFFMYLEEVSQFQSKVNQHFGYTCDKSHSVFYHILNDRIKDKSVSVIWRDLDLELAKKRIPEILKSISPIIVEEIETLLEHYITSYSTLPDEIRIEFYMNAEEFILARVFNFLNSHVDGLNYMMILKKSTVKEVISLDITLSSMIKCIIRQRERLANNPKVSEKYKEIITELERVKEKFYNKCGAQIHRCLFDILEQDIHRIKDQTEKPVKFTQSAKIVVGKLLRKLMAAELTTSAEKIVICILNLVEWQLKQETWMKLVERFKKEIIKQQLLEMWTIFVENLPKVEESLSTWKMKVEQELNK